MKQRWKTMPKCWPPIRTTALDLYNTALCLEKLKRYEPAAEAFQKAAESSPNLAEARPRIGHLPASSATCRGSAWLLRRMPETQACLRQRPLRKGGRAAVAGTHRRSL